jgi:plastocyanin
MSHDERGHEREPIILTSGRRMAKGLAIVVIVLAVGAAIAVPFFHDFYKNPPPVTQIHKPTTAPTGQPAAETGTTTISILQGASTQGNPDFSSDEKPQVPLGNKIMWENQDTIPHTATSGTDPKDPQMGKIFDTGIISGGEKSKAIELKDVKEGDSINYFCSIHPYMTSKITITGKEQAGATGGTSGGNATGAAGATLTILEGASTQGSPDFDPDPLKAKVGDTIHVVNKDTIPHTVTSGNGATDPDKGKLFDTSIITGGESADIKLDKVKAGEVNYFCSIHPYMMGKISVE